MRLTLTLPALASWIIMMNSSHAFAAPAPSAAPTVTAETAIKKRVQSALPPTLAVTKLWLPPSLAARQVSWVSVTWRSAPRPGLVTTRVSVRGPRGPAEGWVRLRVQALVPVLVARKPLIAGERIEATDLRLVRRAVDPGDAWTMLPEALLGAKILSAAPPGALITGKIVAEPAPFARGSRVMVIVKKGGVTVSAPGLLERSTRMGSAASARLVYGRRVVRGQLVDAKTLFVRSF